MKKTVPATRMIVMTRSNLERAPRITAATSEVSGSSTVGMRSWLACTDISVSISRIPNFIEQGVKAALDILPGIRPYPLGHIGDGNIHFSFMGPVGMDHETLHQYAPAITRAVNDLVRDMAGSISAEHGIGIDKIDELAHYRSGVELDTMRAIKRALDPQNLMNPGKILEV